MKIQRKVMQMNYRAMVLFVSLLLPSLILSDASSDASTPQPAPRIEAGSWNSALQEHPRFFGSREHLLKLAQEKSEAYKEIRQGESLVAVGIRKAVEGIQPEDAVPFIEEARKNVARGITNIHQDTHLWLTQAAYTYDFFYDLLSSEDRQKILQWMNGHLNGYTTDENAFHNSTLSKIQCYLQIAYCTWGENPKAPEFRDYALQKLYEGKVLPVILEFGEGGGFTECGWYTRHSLLNLVQGLETTRRFEGYDGFQKALPFYYQRLKYELFQPSPGFGYYGAEHYPVEGDGADTYGGHTEYPRHLRTLLAQYFRGSENARYVMSKRRKGSNPDSRLIDFLYEEEPDEPLPLEQVPLAYTAPGIGKVYARSDWSDDATWFRFECGDYWAGHQHFETGNFEIFRRAPLATESGEYHDYTSNHSVNWLIRTIAHNCILVYDPEEQWQNMRDGGRNAYANDGGQAKKWEWTVDTLADWKRKRDSFERGDLVAFVHQPEFLYTAGDCTAAYSPEKLEKWVRQILFIRPSIFVIYDQVISTKPDYEKTWLLHSRNEPLIQENQIQIVNGNGELIVKTLLPENPVLEKIHGYTYGGQTFDPPRSALTPTANLWRMEIQPKGRQKEDEFLHVLFTDAPQSTDLVKDEMQIHLRVGETEVTLSRQSVGGEITIQGKKTALEKTVSNPGSVSSWEMMKPEK